MTVTIHAACGPGEARVAVWDGRALLDYAIWRPGAPDGVGDFFRGRVIARVPAMAGAFIALPGGPDGFLPDSAGGGGATEGDAIGVRVTRAPQGGKGPRLAATRPPEDLALVGTGPPALLRAGPGAIERLAALHPGAPVLIDDAGMAAPLRPALGPRLRIVADAFADERIRSAVAALAEPTAELPGGALLHVAPTPALTALDVDLARASADRGAKAAAQAAANAALIPALARQIRLRNLGGAIVVDLGGMPARKRVALAPDFARALEGDPLAPRFLGFSALGLAEILRPRVHPPLHEVLAGPHAAGLRALRAAMERVMSAPGEAPVLRAAPAIVAALERDVVAQDAFSRRTGHRLTLIAETALAPLGWRVAEGG